MGFLESKDSLLGCPSHIFTQPAGLSFVNRVLKNSIFCFWTPAFAGVTEKNPNVFVIPAKAGIQILTEHSLFEQPVN